MPLMKTQIPLITRMLALSNCAFTFLAIELLAISLAVTCCANLQAADSVIAIESTSVVDVVSGEIRKDSTIVIEDDTIKYVGQSTDANIPEGATRIDGRGKFAIPGLWDLSLIHI